MNRIKNLRRKSTPDKLEKKDFETHSQKMKKLTSSLNNKMW